MEASYKFVTTPLSIRLLLRVMQWIYTIVKKGSQIPKSYSFRVKANIPFRLSLIRRHFSTMAPTSTSRALASKAAPSKKYKNVNWKILSRDQQQKAIDSLLDESEDLVQSAEIELQEARELVGKAGLSIDGESDVATAGAQASFPSATAVASTTGGHSNTDHVVFQTGDAVTDRIQELKRNLSIRTSFAQQHTESTLQKWDKPRAPGERRRRVVRDNPDAPAEPPPSGYVWFVLDLCLCSSVYLFSNRHSSSI
jgi:hypothetical protein